MWLFCHELNSRSLVISRVLATFVQSRLCLGWPGRPGLCPKMFKTRVLQIVCQSVLQIWPSLARRSRCFSGFGHLFQMAFAWTGLEGLVSAQKCAKNPNLADVLQKRASHVATFGPLPHLSLRMWAVALCSQVALWRGFRALPCNYELHPVLILFPSGLWFLCLLWICGI